MEQMIRKQIYILRRQQTLLKRAAKKRGVSEAEIIRRALDRELSASAALPLPSEIDPFEKAMLFIQERRAQVTPSGKPYRWRREDAYEERMNRLDRKLKVSE
jgi:hypothetical protein